MHLILIIAAGILLAFVLLPLLGPIAMIAICVAVIVFIGYSIFVAIGMGMAAVDAAKKAAEKAKTAQSLSFKTKVKTAPEFRRGLAEINELLSLQGLRHRPIGLWYSYILNERFRNCYMTGAFRVEDQLNRTHLEKYLKKAISRGNDPTTAPQADALYQEILSCHDSLCKMYLSKRDKTSQSSNMPKKNHHEVPKPKSEEYLKKNYLPQYAFNQQSRKLHAITCKSVNDTFRFIVEGDLDALLDETDGEITCCKLCLKDDEKVQALVETHNRKIRKLL